MALRPLTLRQVYGLNPLLPPQDLTCETDENDSFVYCTGNLTIIQNGHDQIILHGHTNDVSAFDVAKDKSLIVTGELSSIIVWDVETLSPMTVFDSEEYTPISLVFNNSGTGLMSLDDNGEIRYYELNKLQAARSNEKGASFKLTEKHALRITSGHTKLSFSENDDYFLSFGPSSILPLKIDFENSTINACGHGQNLAEHEIHGTIHDTQFYNGNECASSMSNGTIVIWKPSEALNSDGLKLTYNRTIRLANENEHLTVIKLISKSTLAVGSSNRKIRFYDLEFKLKNVVNSKHIIPAIHGNITSISLKFQPKYDSETDLGKPKQPKFAETTLEGEQFQTKNLLLTTSHGEIVRIQYDGTTDIKAKSSTLEHGKNSERITSFEPHRSQPLIALGLQSSVTNLASIELFDYEKQARVTRKELHDTFEENETISVVNFDEQGVFLAVGTNKGKLYIFDALTLDLKFEFLLSTKNSGVAEQIVFHDSWFVVSDTTFSITLFRFDFGGKSDGEEKNTEVAFQYLGRCRSHTNSIVSMIFKEDKLITIGYDRYMVEYDLTEVENKGEQSMLHPSREPSRLEQTARPVDSVLHPTITSKSNEEFLLTITDQQKLRLFNLKTRLARKTTLAPLSGFKIESIKVVEKSNLLAFSAGTKIGLIQLPADGNPWRQTAILAHPSGVERIAVSHCGNFLFSLASSTEKHGCLQCWEISASALQAQLELCPSGIEPFIALMENGRTGNKFNSLKTYFYYASLLDQGIQTSAPRVIKESLPLKFLPDILRACGYYPSEKEVEEMSNEVLFWKYGIGEVDEIQAEITLEDVVKLYVNYQHVHEDGRMVDQEEELINAIDGLETDQTKDILSIIQARAEALSEEEIASRMACLTSNQPAGVEQEWPKTYNTRDYVDLRKAIPRDTSDLVDLIFKKK